MSSQKVIRGPLALSIETHTNTHNYNSQITTLQHFLMIQQYSNKLPQVLCLCLPHLQTLQVTKQYETPRLATLWCPPRSKESLSPPGPGVSEGENKQLKRQNSKSHLEPLKAKAPSHSEALPYCYSSAYCGGRYREQRKKRKKIRETWSPTRFMSDEQYFLSQLKSNILW